jgi:hypothetical protein
MNMPMTDRDNAIIKNWFEPYHYATFNMLEKVFLRHQDYSYNIIRKRVSEMIKLDYIKGIKDETNNKTIFIYKQDKIKLPNKHRLLLLQLLADCKYLGFNIERFDIEKQWMEGKIRSDAFLQFTANNLGDEKGKRCYFFVEVQLSNNYHNLEKYDSLFESGECQKFLGKDKDYFPKILLISDRNYSNIKFKHSQCKVYQINEYLDSLASILL